MCVAEACQADRVYRYTAVQVMARHTTPSVVQVIHDSSVHETPADLNDCLTTSVCVKCIHSYTFNTKHVSSKTVKHAANHEMHVLVAHLLQPSSG